MSAPPHRARTVGHSQKGRAACQLTAMPVCSPALRCDARLAPSCEPRSFANLYIPRCAASSSSSIPASTPVLATRRQHRQGNSNTDDASVGTGSIPSATHQHSLRPGSTTVAVQQAPVLPNAAAAIGTPATASLKLALPGALGGDQHAAARGAAQNGHAGNGAHAAGVIAAHGKGTLILSPPPPPHTALQQHKVDYGLSRAILACRTWQELHDLLLRREVEAAAAAARAAAAAAAAVAAATAAAVDSSEGRAQVQAVRTPASVPVGPTFNAVHVATALRRLAELVGDPSNLSRGERLQVGEVVRSLGAHLLAQPPASVQPVDISMALQGLAKLLGRVEAADVAPAPAPAPTVQAGGQQQHAVWPRMRSPAVGTDGSADDGLGMQAGAPGQQPSEGDLEEGFAQRQAKGWQHEGDMPPARREVAAATGTLGPRPAAPRRAHAVHATWLAVPWVEQLLAHVLDAALPAAGSAPHSVGSSDSTPAHAHLYASAASAAGWEPQHVSGVLWALATLGLRPRDAALSQLTDMAAAFASPPGGVGSGVTGPGAAGDGRRGVGAAAAVAGAGAQGAAASLLLPQGISLSLWALARLGFRPREGALAALMAACEGGMRAALGGGAAGCRACRAVDVAQAMWAASSLGWDPGHAWLELAVAAIERLALQGQADGHSVSMALYSLARMGTMGMPWDATQQQQQAQAAAAAAAGAAGNTAAPASRLAAPLLRCSGELLWQMSPRQVAAALWAVAALGLKPSPEWLQAFWVVSSRQMASGAGPSSGSSMAASASSSSSSTSSLSSVSASVLSASYDGTAWPASPRFSGQVLAMVATGLSRLSYRPPLRWMVDFLEACRPCLPSMGAWGLVSLACALARLSYRPPQAWVSEHMRATHAAMPNLGPQGVSLLMWAYASLNRQPRKRWVRSALAATLRPLHDSAAQWRAGAAALEARMAEAAAGSSSLGLPLAEGITAAGEPLGQQRKAKRQRSGGSSEAGAVAQDPDEALLQQLQPLLQGGALAPNELAALVWGLGRSNRAGVVPQVWHNAAAAACVAALRYSRAAVRYSRMAAAGNGAGQALAFRTAAAARAAAAAKDAALQPRHVSMLLAGWTTMGMVQPPMAAPQAVLAQAAALVEEQCDAQLQLQQQPAAAAAAAAGAPSAAVHGGGTAGAGATPQLAANALWACARAGWSPHPAQLHHLLVLHSHLAVAAAAAPAVVISTAAAAAATPPPALSPGDESQSLTLAPTQEQRLLLQPPMAALRRDLSTPHGQAEWGMLVWAVANLGYVPPHAWLQPLLDAVGERLGAQGTPPVAEAAASGAAAATTSPAAGAAAPLSLRTLFCVLGACVAWGISPGKDWLLAAESAVDRVPASAPGSSSNGGGSSSTAAGVVELRRPPQLLQRYRANLEAGTRAALEQLWQLEGGRPSAVSLAVPGAAAKPLRRGNGRSLRQQMTDAATGVPVESYALVMGSVAAALFGRAF